MKRKIGILLCLMLLISMTFTISTGQKIIKDCNETKNSMENSPPSDPVLTAPDTAKKNTIFVIKALSNDPDGDQIYYRFKIGEDSKPRAWKGPYYSGYQFILRIGILGYKGDLIIGFQAKDINGAESEWCYHTITYTHVRSRTFVFSYLDILFSRLSQRFNK